MRDLESNRFAMPLITKEHYLQCLNLGIFGGFASVISIILRWIYYPSYITAILSDSTYTQFRIRSIIDSISYLDVPLVILIGIGFFGFFARHGLKEGYLFILIFILFAYSYPINSNNDIRNLLFLNSVDIYTTFSYVFIILQSFVLFLILFKKSKSGTDSKVTKLASFMILISPLLEYAWFYLSEPLRFSRDLLANRILGTMTNGILMAVPNLILTVFSAAIFSLLFYKEKQSDGLKTQIDTEAIGHNEDELIVVKPPLMDSEIARYLILLGIAGGISMFISLIVKSVLLSQYYSVLFSDGVQAASAANQSLFYLLQLNLSITFVVSLGFFGVFAKNEQRIGYIFLLMFILPVSDQLYTLIGPVVIALNPAHSIGFLYNELEIIVATVLALLLWKNKDTISNKTLLAVTCLALVSFEIIQVLWTFHARDLFVQYDLVNLSVEGTYADAMLSSIPDLLFHFILSFLYISLFISESRNKGFGLIGSNASDSSIVDISILDLNY